MKISYNWLKSYIENIPEADKLADIFTYKITEVESIEKIKDDTVFDLKILPDRAHDLLSHQGVARELAGVLGLQFKNPHLNLIENKIIENKEEVAELTHKDVEGLSGLQVNIETSSCRRYTACIVRNITVAPSPSWMVTYLEAIGQRSINNIVDATNMVMYDTGQPTHAFDLSKINNVKDSVLESKKIFIKNATDGEKLKLVGRDGTEVILTNNDMVISNGVNTLAIAGVKGGMESGVSEATTGLILEVANFDPVSVRKTAKRLSIFTDSSKRFENNLSPTLCTQAMAQLRALIKELCAEAVFEDVVDVYPSREQFENKKTISVTTDFINKKLGASIKKEEIENILKNYNYEYKYDLALSESGENYTAPETSESSGPRGKSPDHESSLVSGASVNSKAVFAVKIPLLRFDLENPIDMVEEIARSYGYDKIQPTLPKIDFAKNKNAIYERIVKIKNLFTSQGYREVMTYTFANTGETQVLASASDKKFLRTNLLDGLKKSYELNKNNMALLGLSEIKIFEIGTVFNADMETINVAYINKKESNELPLEDFLNSDGQPNQNLFQILENFFGIQIPEEKEVENIKEKILTEEKEILKIENKITNKFKSWSVYPYIVRDISVWVPVETDENLLFNLYKEQGGNLLVNEPQLFDKFTKNERTSYAYRLVFQSPDRTLTDEEINPIMQQIEAKIKEMGFEIR